jgi:hypothetical protein
VHNAAQTQRYGTTTVVLDKNDQTWIGQKNGAVMRTMVGHDQFCVLGDVRGMLFLKQAANFSLLTSD